MGLRPSKVDEKHTHRRRPGEYGASPGVFFSGAVDGTRDCRRNPRKWTKSMRSGTGVATLAKVKDSPYSASDRLRCGAHVPGQDAS